MFPSYPTADELQLFQRNLQYIRILLGYTAEAFASVFGVTRQTIVNLENRKAKLSVVHYYAIYCFVISEVGEVIAEPGNLNPSKYSEAVKSLIRNTPNASAIRDAIDDCKRVYPKRLGIDGLLDLVDTRLDLNS